MATKKVSKRGKGTYAAYRSTNRYATNKRKKLERHLKKFNNDKTAKSCLEKGIKAGFSYKRKTPVVSKMTHSDRRHAAIWKEFGRNYFA